MANGPHYDIYLSYSGRKCYLTCPRKYMFSYIQRLPQQWNLHDTVFGKSMGKVFEWFYNRQFWMSPDVLATTLASVESATRAIFVEEKADTSEYKDLFLKTVDEVRNLVPRILDVIRKHKLLTDSSRSEVDLTLIYTSPKHGSTLKLGGKADFIHGTKNPISIIDGKGSKHREKYVDPEQLIWYSVLYYIKYGVAPDKLGFLHYKFPDEPIQWILYDADAMRANVDTTFEVANKIKLKIFDPKTGPECSRCDYQNRCEEGRKHVAARKVESGSRIESSIFDLDPV